MIEAYPNTSEVTAKWAFERYETIRHTLPTANFPKTSTRVAGLADLANHFDVFLLDAFGVLNVGQTAIKTASAAVLALQSAGKEVMVLTNGASLPATESQVKFEKLGFNFVLEHIVASRDALCHGLAQGITQQKGPALFGVMSRPDSQLHTLPIDSVTLGEDAVLFDKVSGFILLGASYWTEHQQHLLIQSLCQNPRPVWVGNPDLVAPNEHHLSLEPGYFAHQLSHITGVTLHFFGKPFSNIYELACARLDNTPKHRILMVGDTLHTDILGGAAYGVKTALVTGHGLFAKQDVTPYINQSGIVPDYIMVSP
jgi:HAD superfamily hydrolase (TIGR01459 family)